MDMFGSVVDRTCSSEASFLTLRIRTQLRKRLQRAIVVDSATHSQKESVEGDRGCSKDGAEAQNCAVPARRSAGSEV